MDVLNSYVNGNKQDLLQMLIFGEAAFTFAFVICSFVVAGTANAGFNCVLTGFLNIAVVAGSYYVITKSKSPIAVGFLIGSVSLMTFLNFTTGIYWAQLSHCDTTLDGYAPQYSCSNRKAYAAVAAFSFLLFIFQGVFSYFLILHRGEFINESGLYDDISPSSSHGGSAYAPVSEKFGNAPPPSADL